MNIYNKFLRIFFLKDYIQNCITKEKLLHEKKLKSKALTTQERHDLEQNFRISIQEWEEYRDCINDAEMVKKAKKMDIELEDFEYPDFHENNSHAIRHSHYYYSEFWYKILFNKTRQELRKEMKERLPSYRKERKEAWDIWIKFAFLLIALIGSATGLISTINQKTVSNDAIIKCIKE